MASTHPDDVRMSLGEHLEELRYRLFMGLIGPVVFAVGLMFVAKSYVTPFLCKPLMKALQANNQSASLFEQNVGGSFSVFMKISLIGGLILGIPWLGYQLWRFVAPALYAHERKYIVWMIPGSAALAMIGVTFMYYVMLPFTLYFLVAFTGDFPMPDLAPNAIDRLISPEHGDPATDALGPALSFPVLKADPVKPAEGSVWIKLPEHQIRVFIEGKVRKIPLESATLITPQFHVGEYISFVLMMALAFAVAFQLPLVMLGIGFVGVLSFEQMRRGWRVALLVCFVVGAVLTPNDPVSMFALALPLYGLYAFGLVLVRLATKDREPAAASDGDE